MLLLKQGAIARAVRELTITSAFSLTQDADGAVTLATSAAYGITQEQADARYVQKTGDTMSGALTITGGSSHLTQAAGSRHYLDGGFDTYFTEVSANVIQFVTGGNERGSFSNTTFHLTGVDIELPSLKKLFLDGGGDTYIYEAAANDIRFYAGGGERFRITNTQLQITVDTLMAATARLYLDGGGDTYIAESSANTLRFHVGGTGSLILLSTYADFGVEVRIPPAQKLYLDGGGDTYIYEASANRLDFVTGGTQRLALLNDGGAVFGDYVVLATTKRLYLDGGSDTYLYEQSANRIDMVVGGSTRFVLNGSQLIVNAVDVVLGATKRLYLDGGDHTYLLESADNNVGIVTAGGQWFTFGPTGTLTIAPTAGVTAVSVTAGGAGTGSIVIGGSGGYFQKGPSGADETAFAAGTIAATSLATLRNSSWFQFHTAYWNGATSTTEVGFIYGARLSASAGGLAIAIASAHFLIPAAKRLYLDSGGDTYIVEEASDEILMYTGGSQRFRLWSFGLLLSNDFAVTATKKLYLDGGSDTYIREVAANQIDFVTGGVERLLLSTTLAQFGVAVSVPSAVTLYLDGGSNTGIQESSADVIGFIVGGGVRGEWSTGALKLNTNLFAASSYGYSQVANISISARGVPNAFEWGHANSGGYGSTIGFEESSGHPFIAFWGEAGTTVNTYRTRGIEAKILKATPTSFRFGRVTGSNADNQAFSEWSFLDSTGWNAANFILTSDYRLKTKFEPIVEPARILGALRGTYYEFIEPRRGAGRRVGLIAQDVRQVLPEAVTQDADGYFGLSYDALVPVLVDGFNDHEQRIQKLQTTVAELERQLERRAQDRRN